MSVPRRVLVVITIVAAAAGMLLARAALNSAPEPPQQATVLPQPRLLPQVALVDQDSQPFERSRLEQRWSLLFFGFTRCPAVCPSTLAVLAQARERLQALPAAQRPQIVLISVDPQHDSPAQLKSYLRGFDAGFVGVTGNPETLQQLARSLGASITMQPLADGDYTVDHSTGIFLVDPRGAWRALFSGPHSAGVIADDYRRILALD